MIEKIKKVLGYLTRYKLLSICIFFFVLFESFLEVFSIGLLLPILQGAMGEDISRYMKYIPFMSGVFEGWGRTDILSALLVCFLVAFSVKSAIFYLGNTMIARQRFLLTKELQTELFDKLMAAGITFYDSIKSGNIINSVYNETVRIGNLINCILRMSAMLVRFCVNCLILFAISWKFTLFAMAAFLMIRIPLYIVVKKIRAIGAAVNKAVGEMSFHVLESVSGIRIIRLFSGEALEKTKFSKIAGRIFEFNYSNIRRAELLMPLTQTMFIGSFIAFFLIAIRFTSLDIAKTLPFVAAYLYVSKNLMTDFTAIQDRRAEAASYMGAFESYEAMVRNINSSIMPDGDKVFSGLKRGITFEGASFGYSPDRMVLKDISFTIARNKTTAIVGHSGTGKTTLAYLLLRFYDLSEGRMLVDSSDIKDFKISSWRARIGFVSQDVFVFNASAKENIAYGKPSATLEEIRAAAKAAEIDEYISGLPQGYDTMLGERGIKLSGGQRQRISIARAIIQNPDILILDEATSHLDTKTERQIQDAIDRLAKNRTVVVIAHRLSTILAADNILVLSGGKIAESGTHAELIKRDGQYKNLYQTQFMAHQQADGGQ